MKYVKIEPTVTEDKKIFIAGEFEVKYDYPEDVFAVTPLEEKGGKIITNLKETFYPRRNIKPQWELSYEKVNRIVFNIEGKNVAPVIKKLMKEDNGEELIIKGIATHFIEMVSSSYAVIKNENEIEYNNMYKDKKSVSFKRLNSFGTGKANTKETLDKTIIEKFYTQEELDSFRIENFKDLYCYKEGKINKSKEE